MHKIYFTEDNAPKRGNFKVTDNPTYISTCKHSGVAAPGYGQIVTNRSQESNTLNIEAGISRHREDVWTAEDQR